MAVLPRLLVLTGFSRAPFRIISTILGMRFLTGAYQRFINSFWGTCRMRSVDPSRNYPELGPNFGTKETIPNRIDSRDLGWAAVLKRTFEAYVRGEMPNMYGEWLQW